MMKLCDLYKQHISERTYRAYHGSNTKFRAFNLKKTAQGIAWFSNSIENIRSGDAGAQGRNYIMAFDITIQKPAGWDEYEKYGLGQLRDMGYDGVILPHEGDVVYYIVFDKKNIKYVGVEK